MIGFLLALRTNLAYDRYYEGRKLIGNMLSAPRDGLHRGARARRAAPARAPPLTVSFLGDIPRTLRARATPPPPAPRYTYRDDERIRVALKHDGSRARELRELVRRKAMLLWAFSRQDMRQWKEGFDPDGGMAGQEFNNETFALDPCRPAIAHLIDDADLKRYARMSSALRPAAVMTEMRLACGELSAYISEHERGFMLSEFLSRARR